MNAETHTDPNAARKDWMAVLARAEPAQLRALMPEIRGHEILRQPEIGTIMVRGRTGGTGALFNLGEITVTRCSVRLADGTAGHACVQGRNKDHALAAALADALLQGPGAGDFQARLIRPLRESHAAGRNARARKAAATKVEFFTLVRGEDQ